MTPRSASLPDSSAAVLASNKSESRTDAQTQVGLFSCYYDGDRVELNHFIATTLQALGLSPGQSTHARSKRSSSNDGGDRTLIDTRTMDDDEQSPPRTRGRATGAPFVRDLLHRSTAVRARAARRIGNAGRWQASDALVRATRDPKGEVRRAALEALLKVDPNRFAETAAELAQELGGKQILADLDAISENVAGCLDTVRQP